MNFHNEARQLEIGRTLLAAIDRGQQTLNFIEARQLRANVPGPQDDSFAPQPEGKAHRGESIHALQFGLTRYPYP
jgi:hypothetical protein